MPEFWTRAEYFELLLSAHYATVATFVPTDYDQTLRWKIWQQEEREVEISRADQERMAEVVLSSSEWNLNLLSKRVVRLSGGRELGGHMGEWMSVAVPAYLCARGKFPTLATRIWEKLEAEIAREASLFLELKRMGDWVRVLEAASIISHNLGDLDRVIDQWGVRENDPLRTFYKLTSGPTKSGRSDEENERARRYSYALSQAGLIHREMMGPENPRHLALRAPRGLRRSVDLLIGIGPFFQEWGRTLARHPVLEAKDVGEVVQALVEGWERIQTQSKGSLKGPEGYARAVAGILEAYPGGPSALSRSLSARVDRAIRAGLFRSLISLPEDRYRERWIHGVQKLLG
jgi:hypothetical protein